ncbi:MAG: sulfite exporter TauE/SafE family protein [Gammaproteobacteria bacterium]|nr:MAG: sulfite exporter TauE/SafE family protein [Gammaproteobacteria bacterium]
MFPDFSALEIVFAGILFIWAGFVRSGLGFGGAALGLPFMLFIYDQPVYWIPIIGAHLLFFSSLTLRTRLNNVDWAYLKSSLFYIIPPALIGVLGLVNLPNLWIVTFIYSITLFYALTWLFNKNIHSENKWIDKFLLIFGGYVAGTSLTGAPLMVAVYVRHVVQSQLRNTLFVLWFILVSIKMTTFAALGVDLNVLTAIVLLPVAAIGHFIGLRTHEMILQNDVVFKRVIGGMLVVVSSLALWDLY